MNRTTSSSPPPNLALDALAAKAEAAQWSAESLFDGAAGPAMPGWLPRKFQAALISQFYYSELATIRMCARLLDDIDAAEARRCLEWQMADEKRHATAYGHYLTRLGDIAPLEPALADAYARALAWPGPSEAMVAAFNIVLEGEALRALEDMGGWLACPLFRRLNARICRDEARHLAFGRTYLAARFSHHDQAARLDIYRWLKDLWDDTGCATLDRFRVPGLISARRRRRWAASGWRVHRAQLMTVGLVSAEEARRAERGRRGGGE